MNIYWPLILGAIQGITEVLPISSTAHLVLAPWLFNLPDQGLVFDVALHVGSLAAVIIAFLADWKKILLSSKELIKNRLIPKTHNQKMIYYLLIATIPGALAGFFLEEVVENVFRSPLIIVFTLIFFGTLLLYLEKRSPKNKDFKNITLKDALLVGVAQAFALLPGTSRSGITITAGLFSGLRKEEAAKFSFMLSAPIILGAAAAKLPDLLDQAINSTVFVGGIASSFLFGLMSIKFILKYVKNKSYAPFVYYRYLLAALIIAMLIWR